MKKFAIALPAMFVVAPVFAKGGHYVGGSFGSRKGSHYVNASTGNHYTHHKH